MTQKFIFVDEFTLPKRKIKPLKNSRFEVSYLGNPQLLNPNYYSWGIVKLPKGKTWNKNAESYNCSKDNEYTFSKVYIFDNYPDCYIKLSAPQNTAYFIKEVKDNKHVLIPYKQKPLYLTIKNYFELTAYEVLIDLRNSGAVVNGGAFVVGRHFESTILQFWKNKGLHFWKG